MRLPRVYGLLDTGLLAARGIGVIQAAEALLEGGIRMLQFREKAHFSRDVFAQAQQVANLCRQAGAVFIVNDRADIAMLLDTGLHVGQDDLPPEDARKLIGDSRLLGFSTHNEAQLRAGKGEPVDYLAIGPIFATTTKENPDAEVGVVELRRLRPLVPVPLVAIGGITRQTASEVWRAGADTIAVVSDLYPEEADRASIRSRAEEWIRMASA